MAQLASSAGPEAFAGLQRLRQGSRGALVEKLQTTLGISVSGFFGPTTTMKLAELQQAKLGWSDGIYAPEMDRLLGFNIFGE